MASISINVDLTSKSRPIRAEIFALEQILCDIIAKGTLFYFAICQEIGVTLALRFHASEEKSINEWRSSASIHADASTLYTTSYTFTSLPPLPLCVACG